MPKANRYLGSITMWELAMYIARKLKDIARPIYRLDLEPEDILRKEPSRDELEFYYERLCR